MNEEKKYVEIHVKDIIPNPFQPRLSFNEDKLEELAESIKLHGIIQPLVLRQNGEKYEIIAGERRFKAAQLAGLSVVPAIINNMDNDESAEVALVENLQRKNLTPIEEAKSYEKLQERGYSQEDIARKMGISQSAIANKLRLLNLSEDIQKALLDEKISERHARALLTVSDPGKQSELLSRIINERLTVRQFEEIIKGNSTPDIESFNIEAEDDNPDGENIKPAEIEKPFADLSALLEANEKKEEPAPVNMVESFEAPSFTSFEEVKIDTPDPASSFAEPASNFNSFGSSAEFDPFTKSSELIFPEPVFEEKKTEASAATQVITQNISKEDFSTVIKAYDKIKSDIEAAGLRIDMETFNFDEYYQLIIKVHKN